MDRFTRNLGHEKQGKIKSVVRSPEYYEGKDGDIQIYNGRLYIKDRSIWHQFTPKSESLIVKLTDDTGGTIDDTLADVPGSYTEATLANQLASLSAKINKIIELLQLDIS